VEVDRLVIGKGLIGSAAAKYLSLAGDRVAIVGPDEPTDLRAATVFASHYDSGRVQRQIGRNDAMTALNLRSVEHYGWLREQSGVSFHGGNGCLYVNPRGGDDYLSRAPGSAADRGVDATFYESAEELARAFPEFSFPDAARGMFETSPSGYINPRRLIQAQLRIVERNGGTVVREVVERIDVSSEAVAVTTVSGRSFRAKSVLVTTGAFANTLGLLPRKLALIQKSETVLLAEVDRQEYQRLEGLPSLLYEIDVPELEGIYSTAPLLYPDGRYYLKMGCNLPEDVFFDDDLQAIQTWFREGRSDAQLPTLQAAMRAIMPGLKARGYISKRCVLPRTNGHGNPYIGSVGEGVHVAIGNGWSAMSSDGIGSVAAHLMLRGCFPDGFDSADFEPLFSS